MCSTAKAQEKDIRPLTPEEEHMVEELLREKAELLHERERGLVWLGLVTLITFWCAGFVSTL